jgi:hypothetical protein
MAKKPVEGHCRVCGAYGQLSQEHVPPKRAFNGMPYIRLDLEQAMALGPDEVPEGPKREGGIRFHTLCRQCNNDFGGWYARAFVEWCYQGMTILQRSDGRPRLVYAHHVYPMRVIKQIITMFFSVNSDQFRKTPIGESLVWLLRNREEKGLPRGVRFYAYFNWLGRLRYNPISSVSDFNKGQVNVFSEITYPPFGYVMSLGTEAPDSRLFDITHFAWSDYDETRSEFLELPVLPTHLMGASGDYRNLDQVHDDAERSDRLEGFADDERVIATIDQERLLDVMLRGLELHSKYRG